LWSSASAAPLTLVSGRMSVASPGSERACFSALFSVLPRPFS
jgi:hypothetical protein